MTKAELIQQWDAKRNQLIKAQFAPTALLGLTFALMQFGLAEASLATRLAATLILLASGILGAFAEFSSAHEAQKLAESLKDEPAIQQIAKWLWVPKYLTPAIFMAIFAVIVGGLFGLI